MDDGETKRTGHVSHIRAQTRTHTSVGAAGAPVLSALWYCIVGELEVAEFALLAEALASHPIGVGATRGPRASRPLTTACPTGRTRWTAAA